MPLASPASLRQHDGLDAANGHAAKAPLSTPEGVSCSHAGAPDVCMQAYSYMCSQVQGE
jgi:hypothetical protein